MPRSLSHTIVSKLPKGAITVSQFALNNNISTSLVYHRLKRGKADYCVVVYCGINWVVGRN